MRAQVFTRRAMDSARRAIQKWQSTALPIRVFIEVVFAMASSTVRAASTSALVDRAIQARSVVMDFRTVKMDTMSARAHAAKVTQFIAVPTIRAYHRINAATALRSVRMRKMSSIVRVRSVVFIRGQFIIASLDSDAFARMTYVIRTRVVQSQLD